MSTHSVHLHLWTLKRYYVADDAVQDAKQAYKTYLVTQEVGDSITKRIHYNMRRVYFNNSYKWFTGMIVLASFAMDMFEAEFGYDDELSEENRRYFEIVTWTSDVVFFFFWNDGGLYCDTALRNARV